MMDNNHFRHGCGWLRADFHLHTRKDKVFVYEGEDDQFTTKYVEKLKQANISIGVITNHNKFDLGEFKALRKKAETEDIYLLPGIELFVKDGKSGVHTLIVFHEDWIDNKENIDFIERFLNSTFGDKPNYQSDNESSNHDIVGTIKLLDSYKKDYFLIFAHVEQDKGLWTELSDKRLKELSVNAWFQQRVLGFQKVCTRDLRKKYQQTMGNVYPAEVEGSDPKRLEDIGKGKETYIKIGDFRFDAVKYALKNHKQRIATEIPKIHHSYIQSISFQGGLLDGQEILFHSGLNCLIGIRGSGKSSVLEAIRYALEIPFGLKAQDREYKEQLVRHVLGSGGEIIIQAVNQKKEEFEIHHILNQPPDVLKDGERVEINIQSTVIQDPIYFGQKDLAGTGDGFENDLVEKLMGKKLENIRSEIDHHKSLAINHIQRLEKLENLDEREEIYKKIKMMRRFS